MCLKVQVQCIVLLWLHLVTWADMGFSKRASYATNSANFENTRSRLSLPESFSLERRGRSLQGDYGDITDESVVDDEQDEDLDDSNSTEPGLYLGGRCEGQCSEELEHVMCDPKTRICACKKEYRVRLGRRIGCGLPLLLGDQCLYSQACAYYDSNAICAQVGHNAMCACKAGYHIVGIQKGVKRQFCSEDIVLLRTDLPSLLIVAAGIAVLSGLLCFVLKLFSSNRYGDGGHYANANLAPPLIFSSDNQWIHGIPLTVHGRPSSRSSSQRSASQLTHYRSKGVLVPASRAGAARAAAILLIPCHLQSARTPDAAPTSHEDELESRPGSRRPSISSVHSNASSHLSYSQRRFDLENRQREQRATMKAAREEAARSAVSPAPSPMSTDHLLQSCEELNEDDPLGITSSMLPAPSPLSPAATSFNDIPITTETAIV